MLLEEICQVPHFSKHTFIDPTNMEYTRRVFYNLVHVTTNDKQQPKYANCATRQTQQKDQPYLWLSKIYPVGNRPNSTSYIYTTIISGGTLYTQL